MFSRIGFIFARLCVACFALLTASYCLLAYIPFTYHQVALGGLLPWLSAFANLHSYLYWPVFLLAALTLPNFRNDRTRSASVLFVVVFVLVGLRLWAYPLLAQLGDQTVNILWCVLSLVPLLWLGILDWLATERELAWEPAEHETQHLFLACLLTSAYVWLWSASVCVFHSWRGKTLGLGAGPWVSALVWSLVFQIAMFMAIFMALNFTLVLARLCSSKPSLHSSLLGALAIGIALLIIQCVVFSRLSFSGWLADLVAVAVAGAIVPFLFGAGARLFRRDQGPLRSPLELLLFSRWLRSIPAPARALYLITASVAAGYALMAAAAFDWGRLLQILIVLLSWAAVFGFFYSTLPFRVPRGQAADAGWGTSRILIGAAMPVCLCLGVAALQPGMNSRLFTPGLSASLERYSHYDVGFLVARSALSPRAESAQERTLYSFLASNTNIPRSVRTEPEAVNLVRDLHPSTGPKPNIFVFVIDSLRRDYVSPYNSAVYFTPSIEEFARESVVVQNAFTHYGGTGLSEPSIWAGAMLLHKQYVMPFYPMNALQKLLDTDGYRQFITKDEILSVILKPSPLITELDAGRPTMNCELCRTLAELQSRIASTEEKRPIFAYTQPQNIHISVINRQGRSVPDGQAYPGFDAAYASRIKILDRCFGNFIQFLKDRGMYDNSVVILTADHGDSLGEEGRWGHAYHVVPEVVRVPLIIHLPASNRALMVEQQAPAFLTDITPSLYYLLGHRPIETNPLFGRPLFTETAGEVRPYLRDSYLIASSYAPVYADLSYDGRSLYVVDGIEYNDHLYDLLDPGNPVRPVTPEVRASGQRFIRDSVQDIAHFYHFDAPAVN